MAVNIQAEIEKTREKMALLEKLAEIEANPEMSKMARELFGGSATAKKPAKKADDHKSKPDSPAIERLAKWFESTQKESATIVEMAGGLGVSDASIRQMIYTTNRARFVKKGKVPGKKEALYGLD